MRKLASVATVIAITGCMNSEPPPDIGTNMPAASTTVFHSLWNGGNAQASFFDSAMGNGFVDVWQSGGGSTLQTNLQYSYQVVDWSSLQCFPPPPPDPMFPPPPPFCFPTRFSFDQGFGRIPNNAVKFTPNLAMLSVNVSSTPDMSFVANHCDIDFFYGTFNCYSNSGNVTINWTKSPGFSRSMSGTEQDTFGSLTFRTSGTWFTTSAIASGNLLTHSFTNAFGNFGDTHSTNVIKDVQSGGGGTGGSGGSGGTGGSGGSPDASPPPPPMPDAM